MKTCRESIITHLGCKQRELLSRIINYSITHFFYRSSSAVKKVRNVSYELIRDDELFHRCVYHSTPPGSGTINCRLW